MWALIVLAFLVALGAFCTLILCIPVQGALEWNSAKRPQASFNLVWMFGLLRFTSGRATGATTKPSRKKNARRKLGLKKILKIITIEGLPGKTVALARSCVRQIRVRKLEGAIRFELEDPADAGLVYAVLGTAYPLYAWNRLKRVTVEPVLGEEVGIRGNVFILIALQPVRLVIPSLKFLFSRAAISAVKAVITA